MAEAPHPTLSRGHTVLHGLIPTMHLDLSHMSGVPRSPGFIHTSKTERLDYPNSPDLLSWFHPLLLPKAATTKTNCRLTNCPLPVPIRAWLTAIMKLGAWLLWFILQTHSEGLPLSRHSAIFEASFNLPGSSSHLPTWLGFLTNQLPREAK